MPALKSDHLILADIIVPRTLPTVILVGLILSPFCGRFARFWRPYTVSPAYDDCRALSYAPLSLASSFISYLLVSVVFDVDSHFSLVSSSTARLLGHSDTGSQFSESLTASYGGHPLTTDVELEISWSLAFDAVVGMNWIAARRAVGEAGDTLAVEPYSCSTSGDHVLRGYPSFLKSFLGICSRRFVLLDTSCIFSGDFDHIQSVQSDMFDSRQSTSLGRAVLSSRQRSESVIHDIFFGSFRSGIRLSPSPEVTLLTRACLSRGLEFVRDLGWPF
ncbi:hypothetical protein EV424DRAFT_1534968 [Suillus variegatus]|nr:hypothetical protein EV424DRAFT_1534968 [Suillus variegatus]